ncbi:hypothetical protein JOQ06_029119, partial [Pogonophryne albipinna]
MSPTQVASPKDSSWMSMSPSLQCGSGQLKFRAVGSGASQFSVEQGNAPPMPLSQVPSTCGYSMQRNSHALVMLVPYDGCNMVQEGGSYVLPMRWMSPTQVASPKDSSWKSMSPSLQCGSGQLKFRAVGSGASQFSVEQGNAPTMPLSQVPSTCGYSMQRNSHALVMLVPYDGCNMVQEGGSYVLPMRWMSPTQVASPKDSSWKSMSPSLQCGSGQLKFRAVGSGASQFSVEQGNAPPMPLSQVPSTCGYSMQRNSHALVMLVPYDGCNMVQEGGSYVLPMRWQGSPVSLWLDEPNNQVASPNDTSWKSMSPSLQCGSGQLKFRAVGSGASQFAVEQGNAPPMPLSQVPSTCGYSMQRNSHALVMLVPYDGCNMVQEVYVQVGFHIEMWDLQVGFHIEMWDLQVGFHIEKWDLQMGFHIEMWDIATIPIVGFHIEMWDLQVGFHIEMWDLQVGFHIEKWDLQMGFHIEMWDIATIPI